MVTGHTASVQAQKRIEGTYSQHSCRDKDQPEPAPVAYGADCGEGDKGEASQDANDLVCSSNGDQHGVSLLMS